MKLFIKFLAFVLVLGLAGPFIMKKPDGTPWMTANDIVPDMEIAVWRIKNKLSSLMGEAKHLAKAVGDGSDVPSGKTRVYKWRDKNGVWQLSDHPNPDGSSETILVDPNTNIIQATPLPEPEPEEEKEPQATAQEGGVGLPLPMTVPPDQVSKLIQDAKGVQELMNQRNQALDALSGSQPQGKE